jgi:hypothetical protein
MNAAGNGGCCASLTEGCDGNGIFYGDYIAPQTEEATADEPMWIGRTENYRPPRPENEEVTADEPMWIGRIENYRPPRPENEEVAADEPMWIGRTENYRPPRPENEEFTADEPMWIGRKENYRPPRPQNEEVAEDQPMWIGRSENYRPPRPEEDIEEIFDRSPKYDSEESEANVPPYPRDQKRKHGDRRHPPFGRKVHRFVRAHK